MADETKAPNASQLVQEQHRFEQKVPEAAFERMRSTLGELIYEITRLSPMEDDGSHKCQISQRALAAAREAYRNAALPEITREKDAEIEHLRGQVEEKDVEIGMLQASADEAQDEIDRLEAMQEEWAAEEAQLKSEVERMREALCGLANALECEPGPRGVMDMVPDALVRARQALAAHSARHKRPCWSRWGRDGMAAD